MRRPLPSRSVRTHLPLLLLDGLDLKLGQLIAAEGAADQKRQHNGFNNCHLSHLYLW